MHTTPRSRRPPRSAFFELLYSRDPRLPPDIHNIKMQPQKNDTTEWCLHLQLHQPLLRRALQHNLHMAQWQKKYYDASHTPMELQIGESVRVYHPIRKSRFYESLMHRWLGLYTVTTHIGTQTYHLRRTTNSSETIAHISPIKCVPSIGAPSHSDQATTTWWSFITRSDHNYKVSS